MINKINRISFYSRLENTGSVKLQAEIEAWLKNEHPEVTISNENPQVILVLGGDGTIMEATRKYANNDVIILGINLGQLGFLASINHPEEFPVMLSRVFRGEFDVNPGMIIQATVMREDKVVFLTNAFNEIVVQNPLGVVELGVGIGGEMVEEIRGTGVLVSTPSGSTAYNLSAHGPIIAPSIRCLIITELFDHDIPTPALVIPDTEIVKLYVQNFREHKFLNIASTGQPVDVLLVADGVASFVLNRGDVINVSCTKSEFKMAVLEPDYFYKNLYSKFNFK